MAARRLLLTLVAALLTAAAPASAATMTNDLGSAQSLTGAGPHAVAYDTDGATIQNGEPHHWNADYARSVWVKWTPSTTANVRLDDCGDNATPGTKLVIYKGPKANAGFDDLVALTTNPYGGSADVGYWSCESGIQTFTPVAGQTYYFVIVRSKFANTTDPGGTLYVEQNTTKPTVKFTSGTPTQFGATAKLTFSSPKAVRFECTLDGADHACWNNGDNGTFQQGFADHKTHTVGVRAVNEFLVEGNAHTWTFTADGAPPETFIDSTPPATAQPYTVAFHASEAGSAFSCKVDSAAAAPCTSPWTVSPPQSISGRTLQVAATDKWGNVDKTPAYQKWQPATQTQTQTPAPVQQPVQPTQQQPVVQQPVVTRPTIAPPPPCTAKVTHGRYTRRRGMPVRIANVGAGYCTVTVELRANRRLVARQVRGVARGATLNVRLKPRVRIARGARMRLTSDAR